MPKSKIDTLIQKVIKKKKKKISTVVARNPLTDTDIHRVVKNCRDEIQKSVDTGIMPSPRYFEQAAILSRKEQKYDNEIAICEMYIDLAKEYASEHKLTKAEFSHQVLPKCAPLLKRLRNAKLMQSRNTID